ncbi:hypothetical protein DFM91_005439 [Clostridium beijerinckii]|nr:hypothetical protein [Clostridium beijerinckii]
MNNTHTYKLIVVEDEHLIRQNIIKKLILYLFLLN